MLAFLAGQAALAVCLQRLAAVAEVNMNGSTRLVTWEKPANAFMAGISSELANGSITQDELDRARNPIVNELKKLLMDNHYLMSAVVGPSQEQPQRLERATTSVQELESLTVEQVQGVAKKYLQASDGLPVVVVPVNGEKKSARPVNDRAAALSH